MTSQHDEADCPFRSVYALLSVLSVPRNYSALNIEYSTRSPIFLFTYSPIHLFTLLLLYLSAACSIYSDEASPTRSLSCDSVTEASLSSSEDIQGAHKTEITIGEYLAVSPR